MIKIALDMMGGDNAPSSNIGGFVEFLSESDNSVKIYLVGNSNDISKELESYPEIKSENFEIINATDVVNSNDRPSKILKEKPDSSMVKAINLLENNIVDAVVSAGNTGCLLASSFFKLGTIDNIKRFVVFDDVEKFNLNSLNGLLKIIEEPGINNHFILINNKSTPILDTIRSRCFELKIILQSEERNRIITKLIDHFEQKIILDKNLVKI